MLTRQNGHSLTDPYWLDALVAPNHLENEARIVPRFFCGIGAI